MYSISKNYTSTILQKTKKHPNPYRNPAPNTRRSEIHMTDPISPISKRVLQLRLPDHSKSIPKTHGFVKEHCATTWG